MARPPGARGRSAELAALRAAEVAKLLERTGVPPGKLQAESPAALDAPDGVDDWQSRRVAVRVEP